MLFQKHSLRRVREFEDCLALCERDKELMEGIRRSRQGTRLWKNPAKDISVGERRGSVMSSGKDGCILVTRHGVLKDAEELVRKYPDCRVGVLSFANPCHPGGSTIRGADGQENSLCRYTTLYPCCITEELKRDYYEVHRSCNDSMYTHMCVYVPEVICFSQKDEKLGTLDAEARFCVDVICCSAPDVSQMSLERSGKGMDVVGEICIEDLENILYQRIEGILKVAIRQGIEVLVLGAFGCGASGNSPVLVASIFKKALQKYATFFRAVIFSIYESPYDKDKYDTFTSVLC